MARISQGWTTQSFPRLSFTSSNYSYSIWWSRMESMEQVDEQDHDHNPLLKDSIHIALVHVLYITYQHCTLCTNNAPCTHKPLQLMVWYLQLQTAHTWRSNYSWVWLMEMCHCLVTHLHYIPFLCVSSKVPLGIYYTYYPGCTECQIFSEWYLDIKKWHAENALILAKYVGYLF